MREILFRAKRKDNGDWISGSLVHQVDYYGTKVDRYFILEGTDTNDYDIDYPIEVNGKTVCQCTGLTDKNGVKVFEGDVVSAQDETGTELYRFVVKFGECGGTKSKQYEEVGFMGFYFEGTISTCVREFLLREDPIYWLNAYKCVIIGNLHDNPELLEGVV